MNKRKEIDTKLEQFSTGKRRKKLKAKKDQKKKEKKLLCDRHKKDFEDVFNEPITEKQYNIWKQHYTPKTVEEIEASQETINTKHIKYKKYDGAFSVIFNFGSCVGACGKYLQKKLLEIGWHENCTGYEPVTVSPNEADMKKETIQAFKMACKQSKRMNEYAANL